MLITNIFYPKIIDNKTKQNRLGFMLEESWCMGQFIVPIVFSSSLEEFVTEDSALQPYMPCQVSMKIYSTPRV